MELPERESKAVEVSFMSRGNRKELRTQNSLAVAKKGRLWSKGEILYSNLNYISFLPSFNTLSMGDF